MDYNGRTDGIASRGAAAADKITLLQDKTGSTVCWLRRCFVDEFPIGRASFAVTQRNWEQPSIDWSRGQFLLLLAWLHSLTSFLSGHCCRRSFLELPREWSVCLSRRLLFRSRRRRRGCEEKEVGGSLKVGSRLVCESGRSGKVSSATRQRG